MLRATVVCASGEGILEAWRRISAPDGFDILRGHGRLKNSFGTKGHQPPNMLLNVHFQMPGYLPVTAEVQIHLFGIFNLKARFNRASE